jgi:hypothetical protein
MSWHKIIQTLKYGKQRIFKLAGIGLVRVNDTKLFAYPTLRRKLLNRIDDSVAGVMAICLLCASLKVNPEGAY